MTIAEIQAERLCEIRHVITMMMVQEDRIRRYGWSSHYAGPSRINNESLALL